MRRRVLAIVALAITGACGSRAGTSVGNEELIRPLYDLPDAQAVSVEHYGYDLGGERAADDFFTEVEFELADPRADAADVVEAVEQRLGDGWEVAAQEGDGDAVIATFANGDARVNVTTWDGGFDVTVAADGAKLDGTPLAL